MDFAEAEAYIEGLRKRDKYELERTRLLMWAMLQPNSKERLELDDIIRLDDEDNGKHAVNKDELEELRKRAKKFEKERI